MITEKWTNKWWWSVEFISNGQMWYEGCKKRGLSRVKGKLSRIDYVLKADMIQIKCDLDVCSKKDIYNE